MFTTKAALTNAVKSDTKICLPGATAKLEAQAGLLRYLSIGAFVEYRKKQDEKLISEKYHVT